ncbi:MAG: spore maturation protein [Clostridia bacterium]|nr:spore maturation protein [Clostridia bacterium]
MLSRIIGVICVLSMLFTFLTGGGAAASEAILTGAERAVSIVLTLAPAMALWCGIMQVFRRVGLLEYLSRLLSPLITLCFPTAAKTGVGREELTACITANLLGIGNAATPLAIQAMKAMKSAHPDTDTASDDMITLVVLNTSSFSIMPTTVIALRSACNSADPFSILLPVWCASLVCSVMAVTLCRLCAPLTRKRDIP